MNTTDKINGIIEYIENNMLGNIEMGQLASIACCSEYDMNRMFLLVTGVSVAEYIRKRRMTLAGLEIRHDKLKVTDAAMKYGYDSPVSFSRAFKGFHGFPPSRARDDDIVLKSYPRLTVKINVKVSSVKNTNIKESVTVNGKKYKATYLGEADIYTWSIVYNKREYWRLEDAYKDFCDLPKLNNVLPYNNYRGADIKPGQVFMVNYFKISDNTIDKMYYISDGSVWGNLPSTREVDIRGSSIKYEKKMVVAGKEYKVTYIGEFDIGAFTDTYTKRVFYRIENTNGRFMNVKRGNIVIPYNNYPPVRIESGQVFAVDCVKKDGTADRSFYIADDSVWNGMPNLREFIPV